MVTTLSHNILAQGFRSTQYFCSGQILILSHTVRFYIGGTSLFRNYGTLNVITADDPVFRLMQGGDNIVIIANGNLYLRTILDKYDDYTVRISANINLGANGQNGLCAINFNLQAFNMVAKRLLHSLNIDGIITYKSLVSGYNNDDSTILQTAAIFSGGYNYNTSISDLELYPYYKEVDKHIHRHYYGYLLNSITFQNQTFSGLLITLGIDASDLTYYNNKGLGLLPGVPKSQFHHVNPYIPLNKNNCYINSLYRFSRVPGSELLDIIFEKNYKLDHFGNLGERGVGQVPIYTPSNIDINGGAGFLFLTVPQVIKFTLPVQADGFNTFVYLCFQRKVLNQDFTGFNLNNTYQQEWGFSPIFAFPTMTTVQLGLSDTLVDGQCLSILPVSGGYEYTFQVNVVRLTDLLGWDGILCYVVVDTASNCESHVIFEASYTLPPPTIGTLLKDNEEMLPYNIYYDIGGDKYRYSMVPTYLGWVAMDFNCFDIPHAKFRRCTARLVDAITETVELARFDFDLTNHQTNLSGYPVISKAIAYMAGSLSNHPDSYASIKSVGLSGLRVSLPTVHRIEEWLSLQPNHGHYYNGSLPNNGQSYNFLIYNEAKWIITFNYEYNDNNYTVDFNSKGIRYVPINTMSPLTAPMITSNIIDIKNELNLSVTSGYVGDKYYIDLNIVPGDRCISIRGVYDNNDTIATWATWYGNASSYKPSNSYNKIIYDEVLGKYYFIPPRAGQMTFYVIFMLPYGTIDSMICRSISFEVKEKASVPTFYEKPKTTCCDIIEMGIDDLITLLVPYTDPIQMLIDGTVTPMNPACIVQYLPYDTIEGYQVMVLSTNGLMAFHGYGAFQFISGLHYQSDIYCISDDPVNNLVMEFTLDNNVDNLKFKANPVKFFYRFAGYISAESLNTDYEEIKFTSGKIIQSKKTNERVYSIVIKRCNYRIYNELASFGIFSKEWVVGDFNKKNPLNLRPIYVTPPSSMTPEWLYHTPYCSIELEVKGNKSSMFNC